jgi:glycine/D-amino acid oxidase-like deaminating enzyme/nitrite reductase/ring-hydroxylating ferredoxin subunit
MEKGTVEQFENERGLTTSGQNISYWVDSVGPIVYSRLESDLKTDVVIIGGGIAGITTAYTVLKAGKKVVLIEDGNIGSGETGRTTAHLVNALDDRYTVLKRYFGYNTAKAVSESHTKAIDKIEEIITAEKIDCEFIRLPGYLFLHPSDTIDSLESEFELLKEIGLSVDWLEKTPGIGKSAGPCIRFNNQAQFHPLKYLQGLCKAITANGGIIYTHTRAQDITDTKVTTSTGHTITAKHIVVATNTPVNDRYSMHTKQYPYRTYVIGALIDKGKLERGLWWDSGDHTSKWATYPYHYIRLSSLHDTQDLLIVGGEDHRVAQNDEHHSLEERFTTLEHWTKSQFPFMGKIVYKWSGQVEEPLDSMAFIGRNPGDKNIFIITGDSGNGMTHGVIGAMLCTDLILEKANPWEAIYDPSRITLRVTDDYLEELATETGEYIKDILTREISSPEDIAVGEGGIIGRGFKKIALYREKETVFHAFSGICPHAKCVLKWNDTEKSFDCPCHGSRFTCMGALVNGPSIADLQRIPLDKIPEM